VPRRGCVAGRWARGADLADDVSASATKLLVSAQQARRSRLVADISVRRRLILSVARAVILLLPCGFRQLRRLPSHATARSPNLCFCSVDEGRALDSPALTDLSCRFLLTRSQSDQASATLFDEKLSCARAWRRVELLTRS
jgi:hypothetical protein